MNNDSNNYEATHSDWSSLIIFYDSSSSKEILVVQKKELLIMIFCDDEISKSNATNLYFHQL